MTLEAQISQMHSEIKQIRSVVKTLLKNQGQPAERWITEKMAFDLFGYSKRRLDTFRLEKKIRYRKSGHKILIEFNSLDILFKEEAKNAKQPKPTAKTSQTPPC